MEIEFDEDGRTVITTTDLNELLGYLKSRDKRPIEAFRPVLVLTIDDPVRNDGVQRSGVPFGSSLVASISLAGYRADNASYDDQASDLYQFCFDPKVSWESLPIISEPQIDCSCHHLRQLDSDGTHAKEQKRVIGRNVGDKLPYEQLLRENVKVLVIASHELTDEYITKALGAWRDIPYEMLPVVIHHGPEGGLIIPLERIRLARERFAAEERFLYNHALNFSAMARRALFKIYFDEHLSKQVARRALPYLNMYSWRWAHPLFLQVLHHLKSLGRVGTHEHRVNLEKQVDGFSFAHLYAKGLPIFEKVQGQYELVWKGTGTYPEYRVAVGRAPEPGDQDPNAYSSHVLHPYFRTFQHVEQTGLLGLDGTNIVLSPWGVKFLDIMGPESADPDVLLRWRTGTGEIGRSAAVEAMDQWLHETFLSVKERVAQFPDQLALFDDEAYLKDAPVSRELSLFGAYSPISDADLADPDFAAEVAKISDSEKAISISARNYGLVHEPERMGVESKIIGLWAGVPLAIAYSDPLMREPGWLRNLDQVRVETAGAISGASPLVKTRLKGSEIKLHHGLPIVETPKVLRQLPWKIEADEGDSLRPIIFGVTSTIDKTAPASPALTRRLMINSDRDQREPPAPDYYDGINHFHGTGTNFVTFTCGYFIGWYNETKDTFIIERDLHPDRIERFERNKEGMLGNMGPYFQVDRSDQGYWTVLTDGTTKRFNPSLQS